MPDRHPMRDEPQNWSEAFAALPLVAPEASLWDELRQEVPVPVAPTRRWRTWAAVAAVLVLALLLPVSWLQRHVDPSPTVLASAKPATRTAPVTAGQTTDQAVDASLVTTEQVSDTSDQSPPAFDQVTPSSFPKSSSPPIRPATRLAVQAPRTATVASSIDRSPVARSPVAPSPVDLLPVDPLPARYARSAQLESLLAQVRDERVSSAAAATLADEYESRLALIDASLSDPTLSEPARVGLWDQRIEALQQLVGFAGTQRWLTTQGERYDGQLVSVY